MSSHLVATRNTCFALISAIEEDFRSILKDMAESIGIADSLLTTEVKIIAESRRAADSRSRPNEHVASDVELLEYIDFADISKLVDARIFPVLKDDVLWLKQLAATLVTLAPTRNRVCHSRPLETSDLPSTLDFARTLSARTGRHDFPGVRSTLERLEREPTYVLALQIPSFWTVDNGRKHHNLPIPEFDETGFLGRKSDRAQVLNLLRSHYPVVTIVGEGGIGKTALALRCLYDILDDSSSPYDAIVWVSLKSSTLTQSGVRELEGAITSTIGVLSQIAAHLGVPGEDKRTQDGKPTISVHGKC